MNKTFITKPILIFANKTFYFQNENIFYVQLNNIFSSLTSDWLKQKEVGRACVNAPFSCI